MRGIQILAKDTSLLPAGKELSNVQLGTVQKVERVGPVHLEMWKLKITCPSEHEFDLLLLVYFLSHDFTFCIWQHHNVPESLASLGFHVTWLNSWSERLCRARHKD